MNDSDKQKAFAREIGYIKDSNLKEDANTLVGLLPDYFFEVDASSTGKYHPKYAAGSMGLARHVKAAVNIAYNLFTKRLYFFR